jgi:hypothetical protein
MRDGADNGGNRFKFTKNQIEYYTQTTKRRIQKFFCHDNKKHFLDSRCNCFLERLFSVADDTPRLSENDFAIR